MTFNEWWEKEGIHFNDDFSRYTVREYAERSWLAAQDALSRGEAVESNAHCDYCKYQPEFENSERCDSCCNDGMCLFEGRRMIDAEAGKGGR